MIVSRAQTVDNDLVLVDVIVAARAGAAAAAVPMDTDVDLEFFVAVRAARSPPAVAADLRTQLDQLIDVLLFLLV